MAREEGTAARNDPLEGRRGPKRRRKAESATPASLSVVVVGPSLAAADGLWLWIKPGSSRMTGNRRGENSRGG